MHALVVCLCNSAAVDRKQCLSESIFHQRQAMKGGSWGTEEYLTLKLPNYCFPRPLSAVWYPKQSRA